MPGMISCLFFKPSPYWGSDFERLLTEGSCNASLGQIAPALQPGRELLLTAALEEATVDVCVLVVNDRYLSVGRKKGLAGIRQLMALHKSKQATSPWLCTHEKFKIAFSKCVLVL